MIPVGMKPSTYSWDIYKKMESMVHIGLRVRGGIPISSAEIACIKEYSILFRL